MRVNCVNVKNVTLDNVLVNRYNHEFMNVNSAKRRGPRKTQDGLLRLEKAVG